MVPLAPEAANFKLGLGITKYLNNNVFSSFYCFNAS